MVLKFPGGIINGNAVVLAIALPVQRRLTFEVCFRAASGSMAEAPRSRARPNRTPHKPHKHDKSDRSEGMRY